MQRGLLTISDSDPKAPYVLECAAAFTSADASLEYYVFQGKRTWSDARTWCANHWGGAGPDADLVTFKSEAEMTAFNTWLRAEASSNMYSDESGHGIWMGYTDSSSEGTWVSVDNVPMPPYMTWKTGEPNNWDGNEHCPVVANANMEMVDVRCDSIQFYACSLKGKEVSRWFCVPCNL
jgi:hypothetical protein